VKKAAAKVLGYHGVCLVPATSIASGPVYNSGASKDTVKTMFLPG